MPWRTWGGRRKSGLCSQVSSSIFTRASGYRRRIPYRRGSYDPSISHFCAYMGGAINAENDPPEKSHPRRKNSWNSENKKQYCSYYVWYCGGEDMVRTECGATDLRLSREAKWAQTAAGARATPRNDAGATRNLSRGVAPPRREWRLRREGVRPQYNPFIFLCGVDEVRGLPFASVSISVIRGSSLWLRTKGRAGISAVEFRVFRD